MLHSSVAVYEPAAPKPKTTNYMFKCQQFILTFVFAVYMKMSRMSAGAIFFVPFLLYNPPHICSSLPHLLHASASPVFPILYFLHFLVLSISQSFVHIKKGIINNKKQRNPKIKTIKLSHFERFRIMLS